MTNFNRAELNTTPRGARVLPWPAAVAVVLAGSLLAGAVDWTVSVRRAEVKSTPGAFVRPTADMELGDSFEGVQEGDWVRLTEKDKGGFIHRSALAAEGEERRVPFMSFQIGGTFYPEDVTSSDVALHQWMTDPVARETGPAPRAWALEDFRAAGGLGGGK